MSDDAKPPASPGQIDQALALFGLSRRTAADFHLSVKIAYRKQAMLHHPDRHLDSSAALAAKGEADFKRFKEAYELLLEERKAGRWPPLAPAPAVKARFSELHPDKPKPRQEAKPSAARRKQSNLEAAARKAFEGLAETMEGAARRGSPADAARACADRVAAFFGGPAGLAQHFELARRSFHEAFWRRPAAGMGEAADAAADLLRSRGQSLLAECLDPRSLPAPGPMGFDFAQAIWEAAPKGRELDEGELRYYRELGGIWGGAPGPDAMARAGAGRSASPKPLMAELLESCPGAAEGMARLCDPARMAAAHWIRAAASSTALARALEPALRLASLDDILAAAASAGDGRRREWQSALGARIAAEGRSDLAGDFAATPAMRDAARAWAALAGLEAAASQARPPGAKAAALAYDPGSELALQALAHGFAGRSDEMASCLALAASRGLDGAHPLGFPLASALALRGALRPETSGAAHACLREAERLLGPAALAEEDPLGMDARRWRAKAPGFSGPAAG